MFHREHTPAMMIDMLHENSGRGPRGSKAIKSSGRALFIHRLSVKGEVECIQLPRPSRLAERCAPPARLGSARHDSTCER